MAVAAPTDTFKAWFPAYKPCAGRARLRLLCFPSAGSAENIFTGGYLKDKKRVQNFLMNWISEASAEILSVQPPGREQRRGEPFLPSCKEIAAQVLPLIEPKITDGVPYVVIAHSCGNWMAYELLRLIREKGLPMPQMWFVSCMAAPTIPEAVRPWRKNSGLSEEQMKEECLGWDVNQVVLKPEVWPVYQPLLRADFTLFDSYDHGPDEPQPFSFPIHAFFATNDRRISRDLVSQWRELTTGEFTLEQVKGNHLFVYDNQVRDEWFETISDVLTGEGF